MGTLSAGLQGTPPLLYRHLITCLIANHVQDNNTPHPGTVLSSFLQHLAQLHPAYRPSVELYRYNLCFPSPSFKAAIAQPLLSHAFLLPFEYYNINFSCQPDIVL